MTTPLPTLRVLVVSSKFPPEYAGSGLRAHRTYQRLGEKYGISYFVLTSSVTENTCLSYDYEQIKVTRIASKPSIALKNAPAKSTGVRLKSFIFSALRRMGVNPDYWTETLLTWRFMFRNRKRFSLVHIFGRNAVTFAAISYAKLFKIPLIAELVNLNAEPDPVEPWLLKIISGAGLPQEAIIVAISSALADKCRQRNYPDSMIWKRPNPIDEGVFYYNQDERQHSREMLEKQYPISTNTIVCLSIAKFMPRKKQDFLIELWSALPENYTLILTGPLVDSGPLLQRDKEYYEKLCARAQELKMGNRVFIVPGFVDRPDLLMKGSDVYLMPSVGEALGTPVLESLACGTPVMANDLQGVFDDYIQEGFNGFIRPLEKAAWAKAIEEAAGLSAETMSQAAQDILAIASTEVIDEGYFSVFQKITGRNAKRKT